MLKTKRLALPVLVLLVLCIAGCTQNLDQSLPTNTPYINSPLETQKIENTTQPAPSNTPAQIVYDATLVPAQVFTETPLPNWTATPDTRMEPWQWRYWPISPSLSQRAIDIYLAGIAMGNDPFSFTKIGDCQSQPEVFFGIYDNPNLFNLTTNNLYLQETLDQFNGSFSRDSVAVANGMSVASVFSPMWAHNSACQGHETPLECEFRLHNPSIAVISLGTNWKPGAEEEFEIYLRKIIDFNINEGVLPILTTKADFADEDNLINEVIADLAYEYDIPLWNFWLTVQHLPNHGVDPELKGGSIYLIPTAWDIKSFTGLQALDSVWKTVREQAP